MKLWLAGLGYTKKNGARNAGPDIGGIRGPGPRPPTIEGPPTKLLILFLANEAADDFFRDALGLLQFASVTMY